MPAEASASISNAQTATNIQQIAERIERSPHQVLPLWILVYFVVFAGPLTRPLWFDELTTLHIAKSPSFRHFLDCLVSVDLVPPLQFGLVKLSMMLFGESPLSVRLPSAVGYLVGSLAVFQVVFKRFGGCIGLATLGLFWSVYPAVSAMEARPYGLLVAFLGLGLLCWVEATQGSSARWTWWHSGLLASISAMFLTHCFSPFFAMAFGVGELARSYRSRSIDKRVWAAILLPLLILPGYIPLVRNAQGNLFPPAFQAHMLVPVMFYIALILPIFPFALMLCFLVFKRPKDSKEWFELVEFHELAFCVAGLLGPALVIAYCMRSHVPFWLRYGAPVCVAFAFMSAAILASALKKPIASLAVALVVLLFFCMIKAGSGELEEPFQSTSTMYRSIRPDLPFVTASGLAFMEMDHREPEELRKRLYYLTDREAAIRIRHATLFESMAQVKRLFPIRGSVVAYTDFVRAHRNFLVFATPDAPEDWLLVKLREDGAHIQLLADQKTAYRDRQVYEVRMQ